MTLATTVTVPVLCGPAATAKLLAAIDVLSGRCLVVGLGPGSSVRDYELVGVPFEQRWKRLDNAVHTMRAYWGAEGGRFDGECYSTVGVTMAPAPSQRLGAPIWIESWGSAAGLRRVARLADGWLASGYNTTPELFGAAWQDVLARVAAVDRDAVRFPNGIATMWCYVNDDRAAVEAMLSDMLAPDAEPAAGGAAREAAEQCAGSVRGETVRICGGRRAAHLPMAARRRVRPARALPARGDPARRVAGRGALGAERAKRRKAR